jgi:hypothetical protein
MLPLPKIDRIEMPRLLGKPGFAAIACCLDGRLDSTEPAIPDAS